MSYWRSFPNPVWVALWLFFLPPVNLINIIRMIGYGRATPAEERDENYAAVWMLLMLSMVMTVVVIISILGLIWLLHHRNDLLPPSV